jgi:DnaD/phage-associated family protein
MRFTPIPNLFFTTLLPQVDNLVELKLILHIFWRLYQKQDYPKFVTYAELIADKTLVEGIEGDNPSAELQDALEQAVKEGILLRLMLEKDGKREDLYFLDTKSNEETIAKVQRGELSLGGALPQGEPYVKTEKADIFTLYEQNIGLLTPMIAEELKEAEKLYPTSWIEDAFKEAVNRNKRNWRYIARILERWAVEGREDGEFRRDSKKEKSPDYYLKGKYGHLVRR